MSNVKIDQKQHILRAAAKIFAKNGYSATGVAELGDAVGLGRGALYHHIGSKESLLYEISIAHVVSMVDFGNSVLEKDVPPEEKFKMLARALMCTIAENLPEVTVFFADSRELKGRRRKEVVAKREEFETIWACIIDEGVADGTMRPVDPLYVKGILGMYNYSYLWLRPTGRDPADIADMFSEALLEGLRP